jgi:hypothetical protein
MEIEGVRRPPVLAADEIGEPGAAWSRDALPVGTVGYVRAFGGYRRAEVTGHVGRTRVRVAYVRSARVIPVVVGTRVVPPSQFAVTPDCEIVNRVRRLAPHAVCGPDHIRAVRDGLATALRMFAHPRRRDEGLYWLLEAEISWAVITGRMPRCRVAASRDAGRLLSGPASPPGAPPAAAP